MRLDKNEKWIIRQILRKEENRVRFCGEEKWRKVIADRLAEIGWKLK